MKTCLQLAWKKFGKKDIIYIIKILKWITAMKNTKKKKSKVTMTCYGINLYKGFCKQYSDYWISTLSLSTNLN